MSEQHQHINLSRFYIVALLLVAVLVTFSHFLIQNEIDQQKNDPEIINMSGSQRMLSQRIAYLVIQLPGAENIELARQELIDAKNFMIELHSYLTGDEDSNHGQHTQQFEKEFPFVVPKPLSHKMHELYFVEGIAYEGQERSLDWLVKHYMREIDAVLAIPQAELSVDHPVLRHLVDFYPNFLLPYLNDVVAQYELESREKVESLSMIDNGVYVMILLTLLGIAIFIFHPMNKKVQAYAKDLEKVNSVLANAQQSQKLAALGELSGGIAHEINNALQPILGLSEIILKSLKDGGDKQTAEYMDVIYNSAKHARDIVSKILSFARNQSNDFQVYEVPQVLRDIIDGVEEAASVQDVIVSGYDSVDGLHMSCDQTTLRQVIDNIIKNADDAMNNDGCVEIQIDLFAPDKSFLTEHELHGTDFIRIAIKDTGHGMSPGIIDRIFDPFFTTKDEGEGTGLGMSVSYGIIKAHGGVILVESEIRQGSVFTLVLPTVSKEMVDAFAHTPDVSDYQKEDLIL